MSIYVVQNGLSIEQRIWANEFRLPSGQNNHVANSLALLSLLRLAFTRAIDIGE
jgi:hypothetical protein